MGSDKVSKYWKKHKPDPPKYCSYCGSEKLKHELKIRVERDKIEPVAFWTEIPFYEVNCKECKLKYKVEPVALSDVDS
jgi:hypothetical protein